MGVIWNFLVSLVVAAVVIYIVGRLNLGLTVGSFMNAVVAALVIAVVAAVVLWLLGLIGITMGGGILGALVYLVVAAIILLISDRFLPGMKVNGFVGALVAAIAIGVVGWIVLWLLGLFGITV